MNRDSSVARRTRVLPLPDDLGLPFFTYGAFKPGELAFSQVARFLDRPPELAKALGSLTVRDGLPLLDDQGDRPIHGFLLFFGPTERAAAYQTICRFEPRAHYRWTAAALASPPVRANLLVGKKLDRGRPQDLEDDTWSFRLDPVFAHGLGLVEATATQYGQAPFESTPPEDFDWERFFRLQMAYLLLWSAIERYAAFAYGPTLEPQEKVNALGTDPRFLAALRRHPPSSPREVADSRDPRERSRFDLSHPEGAAEYFYQVRSNLSHRGKGAWSDGDIVRDSLVTLLAVFKHMLSATETV